MTDISKEAVEWPREVWMAELDEHHNGTGMVVLSEFATVPRWDGDGDWNRYIDANIHDSAEQYHKVRYEAQAARIAELEAALKTAREDALREAESLCDAMRVEAVENKCPQMALGAVACRRKIHRLLPIQIVGSSDTAKDTSHDG